ncbi:hypothetical protein NMY22_g4033 [Coprinellus aureogranulatus]|nr:hypothetical protein NMY22_g4033 [Coprinellus aureogranulatus]
MGPTLEADLIAPHAGNQAHGAPQCHLSSSKCLFVLRIVIALSIVIAAVAIAEIVRDPTSTSGILAVVLTVASSLHHVATIFGPTFTLALTVGVDLMLTAIEAVAFLVANSFVAANVGKYEKSGFRSIGGFRFRSQAFLVAFFAGWLLCFSLWTLLLLKALDVADRWSTRSLREKVDICDRPGLPKWDYAVQSLLGSAPAVPGESSRLSFTRRVLVAILVCILIAFGIYEVVAAPIYDMGKIRFRQYKADALPQDFPYPGDGGWNMVVVWNTWQHPGATKNLTDAVSVQRLKDKTPPCTVENVDVKALKSQAKPREVVAVKCAPVTGVADITLQVNYTGIVGTSSPWNWDVVTVYFGLPDPEQQGRVDHVVANTPPIFLFRGNHLVTVVDVQMRTKLKPEMATLGFEAQAIFAVAGIKQVLPSVRNTSGDPFLSTLRFAPDDYTQEFTVTEDYRERSMLAGLAAVGGLGSLLSTLLVILLGTSLMTAVIRAKPYSPFGLLHHLPTLRMKMIEECKRLYPTLMDDLKKQEGEPGVLAYLLDTLIDLDALGYRPKEEFALDVKPKEVFQISKTQDEEIPRLKVHTDGGRLDMGEHSCLLKCEAR